MNVHMQDGTTTFTYKLKWHIPNDLVDNIRGVERTYRISIEFRKLVQVGLCFASHRSTPYGSSGFDILYCLFAVMDQQQLSFAPQLGHH